MKLHRWADIKPRLDPPRLTRIEAEAMAELGLRPRQSRLRAWLLGAWIVVVAVCWVIACMMAGHAVFGVGPIPAPRLQPCGTLAPMCPAVRLQARDGLDAGAR